MTLVATSPCLKRISVGIESTSNFAAVSWLSSTLSLTIFSASPRSPAICSRIGATMRHGPHQGAQKSTRTGVSASRTSAWKLLSVTSESAPAMSGSLEGVAPALYKVKCGLGRVSSRYGQRYPPEGPDAHRRRSGRRQEHLVDDVDDPVGRRDVGLGDLGRPVEEHALAANGDLHRRAVERRGALERD